MTIKSFFIFIFSILLLCVFTNVSTDLDSVDRVAIPIILETNNQPKINSFDEEIRIILWAQSKVINLAAGSNPIPEYQHREPMDLLKSKSGFCYDRSRTLDKTYQWLGFEVRHVYILFGDRNEQVSAWNFVKHLFSKSNSHAITEVKTSRGWIAVDSNSTWISISKNDLPIPAHQLYFRRNEFNDPPVFVNWPHWALPGLYSRRGHLYEPYVPFPELNWPDFLKYLWRDLKFIDG